MLIRNLSRMSAQIVETIMKDKHPFQWTFEEEKGFQLLKKKIT